MKWLSPPGLLYLLLSGPGFISWKCEEKETE
jgi:hypothetical protein